MTDEGTNAVIQRRMMQMSGGGGVSNDATARAVVGMSIGAIQSWQQMRERIWAESLDEYDEQFQASVTIETDGAVWLEKDLSFGLMFVTEPNRNSPYSTPLFTYGVEWQSGEPMFIQVMVKQWARSEQGVGGCKLLIGAVNPVSGKMKKFVGLLHLNFQGYGGPKNTEGEDEE